MTTPSGDPVPSKKPQDLQFNAETLDTIVNGTALTTPKRLGGDLKTWAGIAADIDDRVDAALAAAAEALALSGYTLFPDGHPAALDKILSLVLFGADPQKFYSVKQCFFKDVGTRFRLTIAQSDDAAMTGEVAVCEFELGSGAAYTGRKSFALTSLSAGITGRAIVDFGDGTPFATYDAACSYATAGLPASVAWPTDVPLLDSAIAAALRANAFPRALPYKAAPALGSVLLRMIEPPLFNDDIDLSGLGQLTVRYAFRDNPGTPRFQFVLAKFDGSAYTNIVGVGASIASIDATGFSGQRKIDLVALDGSTFPGYGNGDVVASMRWDFGAGEDFGTTTAITHADGGLYLERLKVSDGLRKAIEVGAARKMALSAGLKMPFVDELANDYLRSIFKEIALYQVDKSHTYVIGGVEFNHFPGIPLTRVILTIRDITAGVDVCRFSAQTGDGSTLAEFLATLPTTVKFQQDSLTDYTGVYAVVKADWSKAVATSTTYTTAAQAGINARCLFGDDDLGDYLDRDHAHEVIEVGAGKAFTTLRSAVESLYISSTNHECHRAHYGHRIRIRLVDDGTFNATLLDIPEFVEVWGNGRGRTRIKRENTNTDAMLEAHLDSKFRHCTIYSESSEYCVHHDDFNRKSISAAGKHVRTLRQSLKDVDLIGGPSNNVWLFGCGLSSGEELLFENVHAAHEKVDADQASFGFHNSGPTNSVPSLAASKRPATVRFVGCQTPDPSGVGLYLQTLEDGPTNVVSLVNSHMGVVFETVAGSGEVLPDLARNRFGYAIGGVYWGPLRRVDPEGATVLATTAGAAVSGNAAPLIFGTVDELGRGEKWIRNGTTKSLGARLGDCSSVNKTLTIGGVTCTFSTNLTSASNSTIISQINAAIPLNPVSEVDIQKELYPDAAPSMRLLNSTGSTLTRGMFVSRSGATTAIPANGVSRVFGFVPRPILNGLSGRIVISRQIHADYIPGAAGDGEFGVTAGALDYAATPKVGRVEAGIVILYP